MSVFKKIVCYFMLIGVLWSGLELPSSATTQIGIGDYLYLGIYQGEPILWRCIAIRNEGPLMVSDRVISYKAFDANEDGHLKLPENQNDPEDVRDRYGSNCWKTSTLRQWLNSAGPITWDNHIPDAEHVRGNAYADEAGFLSNFSKEELSCVLQVTNQSVVCSVDESDIGDNEHIYSLDWRIESMLENYETSYRQFTKDTFFLLNTVELIDMSRNIGNYYEVATPTSAAVKMCDEQYLDDKGATYYWLRDAVGDYKFPEGVRCMYPGGHEYYYNAYNGNIGVRPAFVLQNVSSFVLGNGSQEDPYRLKSFENVTVKFELGGEKTNWYQMETYVGSAGVSSLSGAYASISIGDYVEMGIMDGEPIVWRCVDIDENGPLMLSDKLLRFYAFDAAGEHANDPDGERKEHGSNLWSTSSLRYWLNSDSLEGAEWPDGVSIPNASNVYMGYSPYVSAPGFLTAFSPEELTMICEVEIDSVVNELDLALSDKGTQLNSSRRKIALLDNYSESYSQTTIDKIFLLNRVQANIVYSLFEDYILASPTAGAVMQSDYKTFAISEGKTWHYWLRDAFGVGTHPYFTVDITTDGRISSDLAYSAQYGVRPAFYLDIDQLKFEAGDGSADVPFVVLSHHFSEWEVSIPVTCEHDGKVVRTCLSCGYIDTAVTASEGHHFVSEVVISESLFMSARTHYACISCNIAYSMGGMMKPWCIILLLPIIVLVVAIVLLRRKMRMKL